MKIRTREAQVGRMKRSAAAFAAIVSLLAPDVARACVDDDGCDGGQVCVDGHCSWPKQIDRWKVGEPIPDGYRVEEVHRTGLLVGGSMTLAIGLVLLFVGASESSNEHQDIGPSLSILLGTVMSATGVCLVFAGLPTHKVLVRNDTQASEPRAYMASLAFPF